MSIVQEKKLNFEDFLSTKLYSMGARDIHGTDLHKAYKLSEKYVQRTHNIDSWIPQNYTEQEREQAIKSFLQECYEETYEDLSSHKDRLANLANLLKEKQSIYPNDIYSAASGKRQYCLGLLSSNDQWKNYVTKVVAHEVHDLVKFHEINPYQIHDTLS